MNFLRIGRGLSRLVAAAVLCSAVHGQSLIPAGSSWRFLPGTTEPPAAWRETDFSEAAWAVGAEPFHSDTIGGGTALPGFGTTFTSLYLRRTFTVAQPEKVGELLLNALVDDGFVAWLNGHEIVRHNVAEGALARTAAALDHAPEPLSEETFPVATPWNWLRAGENVLAVQVLNAPTAGEPDLRWNATLSATVDLTAPSLVTQVPAPGSTVDSLVQAEVIFSEAVSGLDAGDLLVNGTPATNVVLIAPGHYRFEFPGPAPGMVLFAFADQHGIGDALGQPNPFSGGAWSVTLNPDANRGNAVLSELVADSYHSLKDEDGDYPDWIELANTGGTALDLRGWALTDDRTDRFKWRFGNASLPGNGYLVVFASQKNKTNVTAKTKLHTNFKLSADGEYLALVAPDGEIVSEFDPFPAQRTDISWGRAPGAPELTGYFATPTPGARNSSSGEGFASAVRFSADSRNFTDPFTLKLSSAAPGAVIRYTLNGTVPTNSSPAYTGPLEIATTVEVRARAFHEGRLPGPVHSEAFIRLSADPAHQALFTSTMPILVMSTVRTAAITESRNTPVQFSLHEPVDGRASLLLPPTFTTRGAAKVRGSSSAGLPKQPYAIEWWDEFNEDENHGILGLPSDSEWVLYAPNQYDPVMIHNPFAHELSRQLGEYSPRTRFVELYVQKSSGTLLTNQWAGIYVLEEKPAIGGSRLDIDKLQPEDTAVPDVTGGYLLKIDRLDPGDVGINFGGGTAAAVDPKEPELKSSQRTNQLAYIRGHLTAFNKSLNATNWRDPQLGYLPYVDLTNWVDYHIVEVLSGNVDALVLSAYFHKDRNGPIRWGPHWDFDRALGSTDGRDQNPRSWQTGPFFTATWWSKLLKDPTAWQLWVDHYQEFRAGGMSRTNMNRIIDRFAAEVAPSQKREEKRWNIRPRGGSYQAEVNLMKNWLSNRVDFIDRQMTARPTLSSAGGRVEPGFQVTITKPVGSTVYYTLDGSDPRRAFGTNEVAPSALLYVGPIPITANTRLVARARDTTKRQAGGPPTTTPWSGPVSATFTVEPSPLTVTEIMFHPAKPTTDGAPDEDEFEFVELRNTSAHTVALPGYRLHGGVDFVFPAANGVTELAAGQRLLLVANRDAFASRYPGIPIAGEYSGRLGNAGARLALTGPLLEPVFDFEFADSWQLLADGSGFSLARVGDGAPDNDPALPGSWRLSGRFGGSPGQADPEPALPASLHGALRVSEIYTGSGKQNFVELEAAAGKLAAPVDLSGWWLTDERDDWRKFRLPVGSVLNPSAAGGTRLVVRESQFDLPNGQGFTLNPLGGEIWLLSANAEGELTGFITGGSYGISDAGQSLIDDRLGVAEQNFVAAPVPSPGTPNGNPRPGPVIVRAVHFHPPALGSDDNTRDEFIELKNISAAPVPLFAPANPAFTWHLRGGVELDFPPGLILPAGGRVLLVGFAPESDRAALGAFLVRHSPPENLTLIGPWRGQLGNGSDSLRLKRPLSSTTATTTNATYTDVDALTYSPAPPWPIGTAGTGRALLRLSSSTVAADPANWVSTWPTPGWDDSDRDGLPDEWETAHAFNPSNPADTDGPDGDPDGDGFTNRMEFLNGSDPRDASDALRPRVSVGGRGSLLFHLAAPPNLSLALQRTDALAPGGWVTVRTVVTGPENAAALSLEETDTTGRFYRFTTQ